MAPQAPEDRKRIGMTRMTKSGTDRGEPKVEDRNIIDLLLSTRCTQLTGESRRPYSAAEIERSVYPRPRGHRCRVRPGRVSRLSRPAKGSRPCRPLPTAIRRLQSIRGRACPEK